MARERGRLQLQRIQNPMSRQVTFSKRRNGLLKKAYELSVLCDVEVAVILISQNGKISEFASHGMKTTLGKYQKMSGTSENCNEVAENIEFNHLEVQSLQKKLIILESNRKHMIGEDLDQLRLNELQHLERRMEAAAKKIRSRKKQILSERIGILKRKCRLSQHESVLLRKKLAGADNGHEAPELPASRSADGVDYQATINADAPPQCLPSEESLLQTSLYLGFGRK